MDEYSFKSTHDCCWATWRGSTKEYDLTQLRRVVVSLQMILSKKIWTKINPIGHWVQRSRFQMLCPFVVPRHVATPIVHPRVPVVTNTSGSFGRSVGVLAFIATGRVKGSYGIELASYKTVLIDTVLEKSSVFGDTGSISVHLFSMKPRVSWDWPDSTLKETWNTLERL